MSNEHDNVKNPEGSIPLRDADSLKRGDASIGDLVKNATTQVSTLVRSEIELAKTEVTDQVKKAGIGGGMFAAAALFLLLSLPPLTFMFAHLISMWMGTKTWTWFGFLIIFLVLLLIAVICALIGLAKVKKVRKPQRTIDSVSDLKLAVPQKNAKTTQQQVQPRQ